METATTRFDQTTFWEMREARAGAGRRRFIGKDVSRTIAVQRKDIRKRSFASRVKDPWNKLDEGYKTKQLPKYSERHKRKQEI